jgi:retron-type reverse transcriptase
MGMRKIFIHTYYDSITVENLLYAWEHFRRDKKSKTDVQEFERDLMQNIIALYNDLKNKTYTHGNYSHFIITDPKKRDIHKATVRDRIIHHLLYNHLYEFFNKTFIADSYSCRIGKGTHKAINRFKEFSRKCSRNNTKTCWVLKCDIRKFFASIDHGILKQILRSHIDDSDTIGLLENIVDSFCTPAVIPAKAGILKNTNTWIPDQVRHDTTKYTNNTTGLPLGNLTSQLLVNIYMNKFDRFVKHQLKQRYYIRYADDFVFLSENKNELKELLPRVRKFLWESLRLELHPEKVFIKTGASGVDFLGWIHFTDHRVLRTSTKRRMIRNIKGSQKPESLASYIGILKHGNTYRLQGKIKIY